MDKEVMGHVRDEWLILPMSAGPEAKGESRK